MKNITHLLLLIILASAFACENLKVGDKFLEKPPSVDVTKDTIFSSLDYANRFLTGTYATLHYGWIYGPSAKAVGMNADVLESLTDIAQSFRLDGGVVGYYYSGQYNAGTENNSSGTKYGFLFEDNWVGIRRAYIFLENADRIPDATEADKRTLKAEARMIIASHYCDMYRHFGGLPWVNKSFNATDAIGRPRLTSLATLDSIVALIDQAIPDLSWQLKDLSNQEGRFTQAGAMGLKARLLLFAASPLFNDEEPYLAGEAADQNMTWHGKYDPDLWQKARDAAKELLEKITSQGGYGLVNTANPRADFRTAYYQRGNPELLISTRVVYRSDNPDYFYFVQNLTRAHGIACPTQEYVDMFPMANGKSILDKASGYNPNDPYKNRDPRLYETALVNGDIYQGRTAELWIGGRERLSESQRQAGSGYDLRKYLLDNDAATSHGAVVQFPYLRLAEIYLSFAEAENEINEGPTSEAYRYVNLIRARVNLPALPRNLSQDDFREAVLAERACELGMEEVRWFDLIRWKRKADFTKPLHGMNIQKNGNALTYTKFELPGRSWQRNWSPKWYLSALPPSEVNKAYGLIQNPGW